MTLRIGTRGSHLARTQSATVARALEALGRRAELVIISTSGDQSTAPSFGAIGPQGVFVREIEQALIDDRVDIAVHSCKDLTTQSPQGLVIAAIPERHDAADMLLIRPGAAAPGAGLLPVGTGARVGTSSARRQAWVRHLRPDIDVEPLRGNVPTRLRKLLDGEYDAILLAASGLARLRDSVLEDAPQLPLEDLRVARLDPADFVPAPAQGALAIQCRAADSDLVELLSGLNHAPSAEAVAAERALLARAEGGCGQAFGAHCESRDGRWHLSAMMDVDGDIRRERLAGDEPGALVAPLWQSLEAR